MDNQTIQLVAYHEAGRVVFAYLCGYTCDQMELPGIAGGNDTKLNSGNDSPLVQAVLTANPMSVPDNERQHSIAVANKLMTIYCAGTCAEKYFENGGQMPAELDMDISGRDARFIEKIQDFLNKSVVGHPDDYPAQTMVSVFKKLQEDAVWKPIQALAAKVADPAYSSLKRFYVEDTLMVAGMRPQRPTISSGPNVGVHEENTPRQQPIPQHTPETKTHGFDFGNTSPLSAMLRDFLMRIKSDWRPGEADAAVKYLEELYKKYG